MLFIDFVGQICFGEKLLEGEFVFAEVVGEDFDVVETLELCFVFDGLADELGEVLEDV